MNEESIKCTQREECPLSSHCKLGANSEKIDKVFDPGHISKEKRRTCPYFKRIHEE